MSGVGIVRSFGLKGVVRPSGGAGGGFGVREFSCLQLTDKI